MLLASPGKKFHLNIVKKNAPFTHLQYCSKSITVTIPLIERHCLTRYWQCPMEKKYKYQIMKNKK